MVMGSPSLTDVDLLPAEHTRLNLGVGVVDGRLTKRRKGEESLVYQNLKDAEDHRLTDLEHSEKAAEAHHLTNLEHADKHVHEVEELLRSIIGIILQLS